MKSIKPYPIVKISHSSKLPTIPQRIECNDVVVCEEPLEIWLSEHPKASPKLLFTTMRTPGDDLNLVRGWLHSSGAIQDANNITSITHTGTGRLKSESTNRVQVNLAATANIDVSVYQRLEVMNSACGVCGQQSIENLLDKIPQDSTARVEAPKLPIVAIHSLTRQLRSKQLIFAETGGSHGVALFNREFQILDVREDVGRHNAFDKLIGANMHRLGGNSHATESILGVVISSRASFELLQKAAMVNIRYVIAMGAPSSLAIDLANDCDICLLGFVKSSQSLIESSIEFSIEFNVYSNQQMLV